MMKFVVIAVVINIVSGVTDNLAEKFMEKLEKFGEECAKEVGANNDDIGELIAHTYPSRQEGKCMIFCYYKRFNLLNEDGSINVAGAINMVAPLKIDDPTLYDQIVAVGKYCAHNVIKGKDDMDKCQYAADLAQCASTKGREENILHKGPFNIWTVY